MSDISANTRAVNAVNTKLKATQRQLERQRSDIAKQKRAESLEASNQIDKMRKDHQKDLKDIQAAHNVNVEHIRRTNDGNLATYKLQKTKQLEAITKETTEQIANLKARSIGEVHKLKKNLTDTLQMMNERGQDPFYRPKTFQIGLTNDEKGYKFSVPMPEHEAKKVNVSGAGNIVKLSFSRAYEELTNSSPTNQNQTNSYQSVTESFSLPTEVDFKSLSREYEGGVLTVSIGKVMPKNLLSPEELGAKDGSSGAAATDV